jgi:hypothetical protein
MNRDTGQIFEESQIEKLFTKEQKENLVPFEVNEIVELKGCKFKVRSIFPDPQNIVTLQGIPKKEA